MITVGVDIGIKGGMAVVWWGQGQLPARIETAPMPVEAMGGKGRRGTHAAGVLAWLGPRVLPALVSDGAVLAVFERVHSMANQGVASVFSFGRSAGIVEGVLVAMGLPVLPVEPNRWKRDMQLGRDKQVVRAGAAKLLPGFAGQWALAKDEGIAEAVLMACWGRWHGPGGQGNGRAD